MSSQKNTLNSESIYGRDLQKILITFLTYNQLTMKAIIYYRKSTDRDDKQANSLEHQLENCRRVATLK